MHLLIIGGSDAGISAALRAHELDLGAEVTIAVADDFPNFSICGLPYYLSGETPDWRDLAHRTQFPGINVLRQHTAESVDVAHKSVSIKNEAGEKIVRYDRLIVATGATPIRPNFLGGALDGVFLLHTMEDSFAVHRHLTERQAERAVLVGAGYIGLEMADALKQRGLDVTLLSQQDGSPTGQSCKRSRAPPTEASRCASISTAPSLPARAGHANRCRMDSLRRGEGFAWPSPGRCERFELGRMVPGTAAKNSALAEALTAQEDVTDAGRKGRRTEDR
jgi:NADH dehydrogenase FAD-containing subunit